MTPYLQARLVYEKYPPGLELSFTEFLDAWARKFYLLSTPQVFALIKPICRQDPPEVIWSPFHKARGAPDTWFFYLFAGDPAEAWPSIPFLLDYVLWHRPKKDQTYLLPIQTFWRKFVNNHGRIISTQTTSAPSGSCEGDF